MSSTMKEITNFNNVKAISSGQEYRMIISHVQDLWESCLKSNIATFQVFPEMDFGNVKLKSCRLVTVKQDYTLTIRAKYTTSNVRDFTFPTLDCIVDIQDMNSQSDNVKTYCIPEDLFTTLYTKTCAKLGCGQSDVSDFAMKFIKDTQIEKGK